MEETESQRLYKNDIKELRKIASELEKQIDYDENIGIAKTVHYLIEEWKKAHKVK